MTHLTNIILAMSPTPGDPNNPVHPSIWQNIIPMLGMLVLFYFILIRPNMKAKKEQDKLMASLKSGDRVTMSSGILGTVTNLRDKDIVVVKIADNVKIEVLKSCITSVTKEEAK